jgi:hypothetical protein
MIQFSIHFVILLLAGLALFRLWKVNQSSDRWINLVIAAGFLGRAVVGQIIFWISYARLPIARELQMGDGLWFFARDALEYFPTAMRLARSGVKAIIDYPTGGPSVAFVKVLSTMVLLLGSVTSVAVLLNLFCYLGTTAIIVRWSNREPRARLAATFTLCAISLSPAFFLWSLQPLKDTFFQFVVIAFIGACAAWQRIWTVSQVRMPIVLLIVTAMLVTLTAISGVRWYFAFALFIAAIVFLVIVAAKFPGRKAVGFGVAAAVIVILSRGFLLGGGPYVPTAIIRVLTPSTAAGEVRELPSQIFIRIEMARDGFDRAGGRTSIHLGGSMSKLDHALAGPATATTEQHQLPAATSSSAASPTRKEGLDDDEVVQTPPAVKQAEKQRLPVTTTLTRIDSIAAPPSNNPSNNAANNQTNNPTTNNPPSSNPTTATSTSRPSVATPVVPAAVTTTARAEHKAPDAGLSVAAPVAHVNAEGHSPVAGKTPAGAVAPAPSPATPATTTAVNPAVSQQISNPPAYAAKLPKKRPKRAVNNVSAPAKPPPTTTTVASGKPALATPTPATPQTAVPQPEAPASRPVSVPTRLITGAASVVVPRSIGERLGLFHIGGGQGMFWFTELDTAIFDLILVWAIVALASYRAVSWRNPLVWMLALLTLLAGIPLVYAISNFGTLFRLREMIYIGLALTPLALATSSRRDRVATEPDAPQAP